MELDLARVLFCSLIAKEGVTPSQQWAAAEAAVTEPMSGPDVVVAAEAFIARQPVAI